MPKITLPLSVNRQLGFAYLGNTFNGVARELLELPVLANSVDERGDTIVLDVRHGGEEAWERGYNGRIGLGDHV